MSAEAEHRAAEASRNFKTLQQMMAGAQYPELPNKLPLDIDPVAAANKRAVTLAELASLECERAAILLRERAAIEAAKAAHDRLEFANKGQFHEAGKRMDAANEQRHKEMAVVEEREKALKCEL